MKVAYIIAPLWKHWFPQYDDHVEIEAYRRLAQSNFLKWAEETKLVTEDEIRRVMERTDASETADQIVQFLQTELVTRQSFLERTQCVTSFKYGCRRLKYGTSNL